MKLNKKQEAEVMKVYNTWWDSYLTGDVNTYDSFLDDDYRFVGSTNGEEFLSRKDTTAFFNATADQLAGKAELRNIIRTVERLDDGLVLITDLADAWVIGEPEWVFYSRFRFSSLLRETKNGWRFIYQHFSAPDTKAQEGETLGTEQITKENQELRDAVKRRTVELQHKTRELEIEAALERIRNRTLLMKDSSELNEAAAVFFQQLQTLNLLPADARTYFCHINSETAVAEVWMTQANGSVMQGSHQTPLNNSTSIVKYFEAWKRKEPIVVRKYTGKVLKEYLQFISSLPHVKIDKDYQQLLSSPPAKIVMTDANFLQGNIGVMTLEPLSQEALDILARFAKVFEFTYTRFLDLQKAEAQVREAQIEMALERVRSRTMAMQKSEELKEAIQVVYDQFVQLNIHVEHTGFVMDYKTRDDYYIWIADHNGAPSQVVISYFDSVYYNRFNEAKEKGEDFFTTNLSFEEKNRFYKKLFEYVPGLPEEARKFYFSCPGLAASTVLLENVGLYIENFEGIPFTDEENNILMRFGKVFQQTYTRFLDLQKAEAQAREAQIETALEKVRSRSLAMHKSDELNEVVAVLFEKLKELQIPATAVGIGIYINGSKDLNGYVCGENEDGLVITNYRLPYFHHKIPQDFNKAREEQLDVFVGHYSKEEKNSFYEYLFEHTVALRQLPEDIKHMIFESPAYTITMVAVNNAVFNINDFEGKNLSENDIDIIKRFARVFDQAYTRFLDLQKAEAQAREAQIETALEKVRSRSLAMHKADELGEVITVVGDKLKELDFSVGDGVALITYTEGSKDLHEWMANPGFPSAIKFHLPYFEHPVLANLWKAKNEGAEFIEERYTEEESKSFLKHIFEHSDFRHTPQPVKDYCLAANTYATSIAFQKNTSIFINDYSGKSLSDQEIDILKRFSKVFEQAYIRFLDLQKAEVQTREAQIEAALEKVRSRSLAMHTTSELGDVVLVIVEKLKDLGVVLDTNGVVLCTYFQNSKDVLHWIASLDFSFAGSYLLPYFDHPIFNDTWNSKESGAEYFSKAFSIDEKNSFYEYAFEHSDYKHFPDDFKQWVFQNDQHILTFAWQKNSAILIPSHTGVLPSPDDVAILKRFAKVFEQSYTRFLDLQKSEAQAREAQIEAGLERVRSRSLAMHTTSELQEVIHTVHKELLSLNIAISGGSFIAINSEIDTELRCWGSGGTANTSEEVHIPLYNKPFCTNLINGIKKGPGFFTEEFTQQEKKHFFNFLFKHEPWSKLDAEQKNETLSSPGGYTRSCCVSQHTSIFIINHFGEKFSESDNDILKRFGKVFEQAYSRFLDLQKAEAQARESEIQLALERVRARSLAMHHTSELQDIVSIVAEQLQHIGLNINGGVFITINEELDQDIQLWASLGAADYLQKVYVPFFDRSIFTQLRDAIKKGNNFFDETYSKEEKDEMFHHLFHFSPWNALSAERKEDLLSREGGLTRTAAISQYTSIVITNHNGKRFSHQEIDILKRFGSVFEQSYTRFLDLQKAEAQAREAKIEAALERVRSSSLAMHRSDELQGVVNTVIEQLKELKIELDTTNILIFNNESKNIEFWTGSNSTGKQLTSSWHVSYTDHLLLKEMHQAQQNSQEVFLRYLCFEEKNSFFDYIFTNTDFKNLNAERKKFILESERASILAALVKNIAIQIISYSKKLFLSDEIEILKRFAKVFEQAYTRFLDLQKAEAQAREAQIETALEKVRSQTMGMQTSEDLSKVAAAMFDQIRLLGGNLFSCGIVLCDENKDEVDQWLSAPGVGMMPPFFVPKNLDSIHQYRYDQWKAGVELFSIEIPENKIANHFELLFALPSLKNILDSVAAQGIPLPEVPNWEIDYGASFKYGYLLISALQPFNQTNIFPRFAKVFEQTYTRFLDLQKAEAQAREAEIELALERVRARTMAMQRSEELVDVATVLFQQVKALGVPQWNCGFNIWNIGDSEFTYYPGSPDGIISPSPCKISLTEHPVFMRFDASRKRGDELLVYEKEGKEQADHYRYMLSLPGVGDLLQSMLDSGFELPKFQIDHLANFAYGNLIFITYGHFPAMHDVFKRFAKVFEQTYTRFLDLQKAEAQTREAQINLAVERVRARALAMYKSEEILELVFKLKQEMMNLDIPNVIAATIHLKEKDGNYTMWDLTAMEATEGKLHQPMVVHYRLEELDPNLFIKKMWDNTAPYFLVVQDEEGFKRTIQFLRDYGKTKEADESEAFLQIAGIKHGYHPTIPLHNGRMCIDLLEPPSDEIEMILTKMGAAFDLAYKRFEDLKNSEAQLREAQIEGALEKVRSRTMGMQQSYELGDVATVLFKELNQLVDNLWTCGFVLCKKDRGEDEWWLSTGDGFIPAFYLPNTGDVTHANIYDAWKKGETYHTEQLEGKALQQHYDWLMNIPVSKKIFEDMLAAGFTLPSWQKLHCAYFSYGYLVMITQVPCAGEQIFKRFAQVFDQTYTRFLDLQKAEFQARQAKIETALEKVRARALAMQQPEELIYVAEVLRHEMGLLGVEELETCSIYIHDETINRTECWYALKDIRSEEKKLVSDHFPLNLHDTWVGREMGKFYGSDAKQVSILMHGAHRKEWINYCEEKSIPFRGYYGAVIPDRTYHLYKFSHGAIGAASAGAISAESWDLLQRTASVFSLAYSRFKDLTQARFDLQRLKEEKQRAETALSELQTTQKQLIQSEKMASLGELTAGIAHEIQNPLNFVNNFSEVSKEMLDEMRTAIEKGDTVEAKEIMNDVIQNLEKINHHGKRADGIVKGMLQHSRSSSGIKEPTNINTLADEYLRLAYHGLRTKDKSFNAIMKTDFDESIGRVNIIPQDIGRVILNLITNAFYVVNEKKNQGLAGYEPTVTLKTLKTSPSEGRGAGVLISVKDNGKGIPEKILDKIFQPFFTTKPTGQGTGLGLSLSYDIVKAHGGELKVETQEGEGSEFIIVLPIN